MTTSLPMWLWLFAFSSISFSQVVRQSPFPFFWPSSCSSQQFYSFLNYSCVSCPSGLISSSSDYSCQCPSDAFPVNFTASGPICQPCPPGQNAFHGRCVVCSNGVCGCPEGHILNGTRCVRCNLGRKPNEEQSECIKCSSFKCLCESGGCGPPLEMPSQSADVWLSDDTIARSSFVEKNLELTAHSCQLGSHTDCQALLNMCVLQNLDRLSSSCSAALRLVPQLLSLLFVDGDADSEMNKEIVRRSFAMGDKMDLFVSLFHPNGSFFQFLPFGRSPLLLCSENDDGRENITMGTRVNRKCRVRVADLRKKEFFAEVFILFNDANSENKLYPLPVLNRNLHSAGQFPNRQPLESNHWQLSRRFFLAETMSQTANSTSIIRFARFLKMNIKLQPSRDGFIFPPLLEVDYDEVVAPGDFDNVDLSLSVVFLSDPERHDRDLEITMAVLAPSSVIFSALRTYSWCRRSGKQLLSDAAAFLQMIVFAAACLGDVFFLIISIVVCWLTFSYKAQYYVFYNVLSEQQEHTLFVYLLVAVILKAIAVIQKVIELVLQQTFFIDWERSRTIADISKRPPSQDVIKDNKEFPPVAWRTYLVANEWSELFNYRKTSVALQMFLMLFLLEWAEWKNLSTVEPGFHTTSFPSSESTFVTRFGVFVGFYLAVAFVQWTLQVLLFERILLDPFHNFMDLCSVANISVLSLTQSFFGYYIHGRSVHGRADTSMGEMNEFLQRERENLCGNRGLEAGSDLQTFFAALPASFRKRYDEIIGSEREGPRLSGFDQITAKVATVSKTREKINTFLREFIDHSLNDVEYSTRDRAFVEALLDVETIDTVHVGSLTRDPSEMAFTRCFIYGNEWVSLSFECALFCLIALTSNSLVMACVVVYSVSFGIRSLCSLIARNQLARCSFVDSRFLW